MPASKAQQKAVSKYMKSNYDEIKIRVQKGDKDKFKSYADEAGESLNAYIIKAVNFRISETPNEASREAIREVAEMKRTGSGQRFETVEDLFADLEAD